MSIAAVDDVVREKKRNLYRLALARSDIAAAMEGCDHLLREQIDVSHALYWTLHNGIVVSYGRPFTRNRPYGPLDEKWSTFEDPRFAELHALLMDLRHKTVAHSDLAMRKVFIVPAGARMFETGRRNTALGTAVQNWAVPTSTWSEIREHCLELGSSINIEVETELQLLYRGGFYTPQPFELNFD